MTDLKDGKCVTINGTHIFIKNGQSTDEAFKATTGKSLSGSKGKTNKSKTASEVVSDAKEKKTVADVVKDYKSIDDNSLYKISRRSYGKAKQEGIENALYRWKNLKSQFFESKEQKKIAKDYVKVAEEYAKHFTPHHTIKGSDLKILLKGLEEYKKRSTKEGGKGYADRKVGGWNKYEFDRVER